MLNVKKGHNRNFLKSLNDDFKLCNEVPKVIKQEDTRHCRIVIS